MFIIPDYEFGNSRIVSVRRTPNAQNVSLDAIGRTRAELLRDPDAGFYTRDRLERQYLVLPQSVADSYGKQFHADLTRVVDELYPQGGGYDPIVVTYNDWGPRTFVEQGNAIRAVAEQHCSKPGFALVMIHHTSDRRHRQHDQLAAMVVRELRKLDVFAAVNHSTMGHACYEMAHDRNGEPFYRVRGDKRGMFSGYLRNVALNKILLTNEKWPFVLATPLHAEGVIAPMPWIMRLFWVVSPSNPPESPSQEESSLASMLDTPEARCRSDEPPAGPRSIDLLPVSKSSPTVSAVA